MAPTTTTMNATGTGPTLVFSHPTNRGSMVPLGVSRRVSETPSRTLSVASVAMIEGILTPRTRAELRSPSPTPARRIAPTPRAMSPVEDSGTIMYEAMTTPRLIIAPTERSRYPTSSAWVWAMAAIARGTAMMSTLVTVAPVRKPSERPSVYQITRPIRSSWSAIGIQSRTLTTLRHLFLSRALRTTMRTSCRARSTALLAVYSLVTLRRPRSVPWASRRQTATGLPLTARARVRSLRRCEPRRVRRRGSLR